ncbi:unnamed protein product [Adineta steineri]|uniref:Rab11 family-interacting protein 1 n=1 Tax=Adineta steineri TaxID=433720 RepID=A0A815KXK5_9BILA|nr:unnamed protein product [Adineta steineri]
MSRTLSQPNYCSCTVHQARNLPDKGKSNGIDAFCTISMGKEKFVTAVREKTRAPEWQEQCDMAIPDDATIKLTVYHNTKNALSKGDFVGRTYVSLRDLQDYDRVHRSWYKLTNKDGKADKERGEIDVSLQFFSKNDTTGSVLDLATKKKHLSLKDIKHSLGSKLTIASKQKKQDNYTGDNQLAHQRHRLGGGDDSTFNVRDFLDDSASESQYSDNFIWDTSSSIREEDEESTSFAGSHMSLNSMSYNNHVEPQQKKMPRAPSSGLGSILGTGTPHSSRRSITSDYDTSSILDSASMYGGDEPSTPSPPVRSQVQQQQQQRETHVDSGLPPRSNSMRRKSKEPSSSTTLPTVVTTKLTNNTPPLTENSRSFSVTGDDIEAAFDAINDYKTSTNESSINKSKEYDASPHDSLFGLSTIKEAVDTDEIIPDPSSPKQHTDEELDDIDFDNCFSTFKQQQPNQTKIIEEKPTKNFTISSPVNQQSPKTQESKSVRHSKEPKRAAPIHTDEIHTPTVSVPSPKLNKTITPTVTITTEKQKETMTNNLDDLNDSGDEDVDELLGKLERMSSMRSSTKRKIQPKDDIMQQSFSEQLSSENQHRPINLKYSTLQTNKKIQSRVLSFDDIDDIATPSIETDTKNILDPPVNNRFASSYTQNQSSPYANRTDRTGSTTLPDIVGEQSVKSSTKNSVSSSITSNKKQNDNGLCVLGYENVKSAAVHPKVRQELDYLDREELLHVIAYQSDLLKKRDTRLKDLESYTDSLLVKILEQCPTILQVGNSSSSSIYR